MESIAMDLSNMEKVIWKQVKQFWAAQCLTMDRRPLPGPRPSILTSPGLGSLIWGSVFHFIFDEFDKLVNHDRPCCENISKWFDHRRNLESQNNVRILKYSSIGIVCSVIIEITKSFDKFEHIVPLVSIHPSVWRSLKAVTTYSNDWDFHEGLDPRESLNRRNELTIKYSLKIFSLFHRPAIRQFSIWIEVSLSIIFFSFSKQKSNANLCT